MTDLASWLLAQIAADEVAARAAIRPETIDGWANPPIPADSGQWVVRPIAGELEDPEDWYAIEDEQSNQIIVYNESRPDTDQAVHIARHDPARVLADCAAKRKVVDVAHRMILDASDEGNDMLMKERVLTFRSAQIILTALAQPFADRPGWDPAWKVEM